MEAALASVALAGNILQFVGVVRSIVTKGYQVKRSHDGILKEHRDILAVVADLDKSFESINVPANDTLEPVIDACREVADQLKSALDRAGKLKGRHLWSHVREAIVLAWNEKEVTQMEKRLESLRDEVASRLQIIIKRDVEHVLSKTTVIEQTTRDTLDGIESLKSSTESSAHRVRECVEIATGAILSRCDKSTLVPQELLQELRDLRGLIQPVIQLQQRDTPTSAVDLNSSFLDTLYFSEMDDREENIPNAHARTYEWILVDPESNTAGLDCRFHKQRAQQKTEIVDKLSRLGVDATADKYPFSMQETSQSPTGPLQTWLRSGKGVFWIWGKPGCGKSTLMKAMLNRPMLKKRLKLLLNDLNPGKKTSIASFYFFRPGMSLQKSKLGLYQSVLYQILKQRPSNIARIFNRTEQSRYIARSQSANSQEEAIWNINALRRAFRRLRELDQSALYLHIDGIDEVDCSPEEIANILKEFASYPHVKVLAAGRYHAVFEDIFESKQQLNLHELTELDIMQYTIDAISDSTLRNKLTSPAQYIEIFKEIFSAAQGVFQWVKLVIDLLRQGARHTDKFPQLLRRLREYPKDLDKLYWHIYQSLDSRYESDAALWILTVLEATKADEIFSKRTKNRLDTLTMYLIDTYDPDDDFCLAVMLNENKKARRDSAVNIQKRIQAQCLHFFEFGPRSYPQRAKYISFSHRTVLDFLTQRSGHIQNQLESRLTGSKTPKMCLLIGHVFSDYVRLQSDRDLGCFDSSLVFEEVLDKARLSWTPNTNAIFERAFFQLSIAHCKDFERSSALEIAKRPIPTLEGWIREDLVEFQQRLQSTGFLFVHLSTVHGAWDAESQMHKRLRHLFFMASSADRYMRTACVSNASYHDDRELLFVEVLCSRILLRYMPIDPDNSDYLPDPLLARRGIFQYIQRTRPVGIKDHCAALDRIFELLRFEFPSFEDTKKKRDTWFLAILIILCLVEAGADPNTTCKRVLDDPNHPQISLLDFLRRVRASQIGRAFQRLQCSIIGIAIYSLVKRGAVESTGPTKEHREPGVALDHPSPEEFLEIRRYEDGLRAP